MCAFSLRREKTAIKILSIFLSVFWIIGGAILSFVIVDKTFFYPIKYYEEVKNSSITYNIRPELILSVIKAESSFNRKAESEKGAKGLMQITDSTADFIAQRLGISDYDIFSAKTNIKFGSYYLNYLITRFTSEQVAICAYNAGEGTVSSWLSDKRYSLDGKTLQVIPYPETSAYLIKILKGEKKYSKYYGYILDKK